MALGIQFMQTARLRLRRRDAGRHLIAQIMLFVAAFEALRRVAQEVGFAQLSPEPLNRRRALAAAAAAPVLGSMLEPVAAEEKTLYERKVDLFRGKATDLRAAARWYRFLLGDLVDTGLADPIDDEACPVGRCPSALALQSLEKYVNGGGGSSRVDNRVLTPMTAMANLPVFDPDAADEALTKVSRFQKSVFSLKEAARPKLSTAKAQAAKQSYAQSLKDLNDFFGAANAASGFAKDDPGYLPPLYLTDAEFKGSAYWLDERARFDDEQDPVNQFKNRNSLVSKEVRDGLKRFPGATLITR